MDTEVIDIDLKSLDDSVINLEKNTNLNENTTSIEKPSVNFGAGIELLMNDIRKIYDDIDSEVNLGDLENE